MLGFCLKRGIKIQTTTKQNPQMHLTLTDEQILYEEEKKTNKLIIFANKIGEKKLLNNGNNVKEKTYVKI